MESLHGRSLDCNRVLIVDNLPLMGAGLEKLLSAEERLQVTGVTVHSEEELVREIWRNVPDVLILTVESQPIDPFHLWQQLENYGRLRIIQISLHSNTVQVYEMKQFTFVGRSSRCRENDLPDIEPINLNCN
ncbi:MAG: response regulator transcription factor [Ardenticatenaceae bacterium]|nr:response regulator transcription factor [Anaerolineales bacterium]MCB8984108.1 response regulator transcription factor [Ardenticatenaceae bacterium]MCB8987755.1 response regulator transcription factor [Ardenticatenaceae bacterium]